MILYVLVETAVPKVNAIEPAEPVVPVLRYTANHFLLIVIKHYKVVAV